MKIRSRDGKIQGTLVKKQRGSKAPSEVSGVPKKSLCPVKSWVFSQRKVNKYMQNSPFNGTRTIFKWDKGTFLRDKLGVKCSKCDKKCHLRRCFTDDFCLQ